MLAASTAEMTVHLLVVGLDQRWVESTAASLAAQRVAHSVESTGRSKVACLELRLVAHLVYCWTDLTAEKKDCLWVG